MISNFIIRRQIFCQHSFTLFNIFAFGVEGALHSPDERSTFTNQQLDTSCVLIFVAILKIIDDSIREVLVFGVGEITLYLGVGQHPIQRCTIKISFRGDKSRGRFC